MQLIWFKKKQTNKKNVTTLPVLSQRTHLYVDLNKLAKKAHLNQSYGLWKSIIVTALVQSENVWQQDFIKLKYDLYI